MLNNDKVQELHASLKHKTTKRPVTNEDLLEIERIVLELAMSHKEVNDKLKKMENILNEIPTELEAILNNTIELFKQINSYYQTKQG